MWILSNVLEYAANWIVHNLLLVWPAGPIPLLLFHVTKCFPDIIPLSVSCTRWSFHSSSYWTRQTLLSIALQWTGWTTSKHSKKHWSRSEILGHFLTSCKAYLDPYSCLYSQYTCTSCFINSHTLASLVPRPLPIFWVHHWKTGSGLGTRLIILYAVCTGNKFCIKSDEIDEFSAGWVLQEPQGVWGHVTYSNWSCDQYAPSH